MAANRLAARRDSRLGWMLRQVCQHFRTSDLTDTAFPEEDDEALRQFLDGTLVRALWFSEYRGVVAVTAKPPTLSKGAAVKRDSGSMGGYLFMLKLKGSSVDVAEPMGAQVLIGDIPPGAGALEHMVRVSTEVYLPLVTNPRHREIWSELVMKDVVEGVNGFVANLQIMQAF